jgi:hypothetical protein
LDIECHSLKRKKKGVISCDTKKNESFCSSSFIGKNRKGKYEGGERNNSNGIWFTALGISTMAFNLNGFNFNQSVEKWTEIGQ